MAEQGGAELDWGVLGDAVGPRVRLLRNVLTSRIVAALAPFGLPSGALSILALIGANESCSQAALARQAGIGKPALVGILDELERRGLATRAVSPEDRRRKALSLTAEGKRMLEEMQHAANAEEEAIRETLSVEERRQLLAFLDRAYAAVRE